VVEVTGWVVELVVPAVLLEGEDEEPLVAT
jgi:hypothetical protein